MCHVVSGVSRGCRLLRAAILSESVMRGDSDSIDTVKEMFSNWSTRNTRFARRSVISISTGFTRLLESRGLLFLKIPGPGKSWKITLVLKVLEIKA